MKEGDLLKIPISGAALDLLEQSLRGNGLQSLGLKGTAAKVLEMEK